MRSGLAGTVITAVHRVKMTRTREGDDEILLFSEGNRPWQWTVSPCGQGRAGGRNVETETMTDREALPRASRGSRSRLQKVAESRKFLRRALFLFLRNSPFISLQYTVADQILVDLELNPQDDHHQCRVPAVLDENNNNDGVTSFGCVRELGIQHSISKVENQKVLALRTACVKQVRMFDFGYMYTRHSPPTSSWRVQMRN